MPEAGAPRDEYRVATFYRFSELPHFAELREPLIRLCRDNGVRGTVLLAGEGVNGTIAGPGRGIDNVMSWLRAVPGLDGIDARLSCCEEPPFRRMKVKLRPEIVTLGVEGIEPASMAGEYVDPAQWNALIERDDVVVIDTRNDYEVDIGTFAGARNPRTSSFSELPAWIESQSDLASRPPVAMFCTGGIRCEKSTAYLKSVGFDEVYHLQGGILNYLATIPESDSLWRGECFVFDERVSVGHGLAPGTHRLCKGCGRPVPADADDAGPCARCETTKR